MCFCGRIKLVAPEGEVRKVSEADCMQARRASVTRAAISTVSSRCCWCWLTHARSREHLELIRWVRRCNPSVHVPGALASQVNCPAFIH